MNNNDRINVRNVYIELLNKLKDVEGVDIHYIDRLVALLEKDIDLIEVDVDHIKDLIPDDATTENLLATMSDLPAAQVNSDWNASSGVAEILNKPTIPAAQVNSDWNATSGVAEILNKPTIPVIPTIHDPVTIDTLISAWSTNPNQYGYYEADLYWATAINTAYKPIIAVNPSITGPEGITAYNAIERFEFPDGSSVTSCTVYSKTKPASTVTIHISILAFT